MINGKSLIVLIFLLSTTTVFGMYIDEEVNSKADDKVLLDLGNGTVVKEGFSFDNLENAYYIRVSNLVNKHSAEILNKVNVIHYKQNVGVIVTLKSSDDIEQVSFLAHELNGACGSIIKIFDKEHKKTNKLALPIISVDDVRQDFLEALGSVKGDRIKEEVNYYIGFHNRHSRTDIGKKFPKELEKRYLSLAKKFNRKIITKLVASEGPGSQESLIVTIPGLNDEIVIIGSHLDNTCSGCDGRRMYGEDDNASGTGTNFEVLRAIFENNINFQRTLEIHAYAAEEQGLVGSYTVAERYDSENKVVVAMLQNDMNLNNPNDEIKIAFDYTGNTELNDSLKKLLSGYMPEIPFRDRSIPGSSDHKSWQRFGVPASFPWENSYYSGIHTRHDHAKSSFDYEQAAVFGRLSFLFTLHFAGTL